MTYTQGCDYVRELGKKICFVQWNDIDNRGANVTIWNIDENVQDNKPKDTSLYLMFSLVCCSIDHGVNNQSK